VWAGTEVSVATRSRLNAGLLLDTDPVTGQGPVPPPAVAEDEERLDEDESGVHEVVPVPEPAALAIGLCVGVTVVFGVFPGPLIDLAHAATLLFHP
jgi:hypothetical protein